MFNSILYQRYKSFNGIEVRKQMWKLYSERKFYYLFKGEEESLR